MLPQYSKAAVYKHAKKQLNGEPVFDKRKQNKGRPKKLSPQDERSIPRVVPKLLMEVGNFTSKRVQLESVITNVCNKTVRNVLNKGGYRYLKWRKKGLLHMKEILPNGATQKTDARFLEEWHFSLIGWQGI